MAGQAVMEGFLRLSLRPWMRRLITRGLAIIPAAGITIFMGEGGAAKLLIFSQVVLSLQLSFAVIPLVMFTTSRRKMGVFVAPRWLTAIAIGIATLIVALNLKLVGDFVSTALFR
jgi:manganese transport protein